MKRLNLFIIGILIFGFALYINSLFLWGESQSSYVGVMAVCAAASYIIGIAGLVAALLGRPKIAVCCFVILAAPTVIMLSVGMSYNIVNNARGNADQKQAIKLLSFPILMPNTQDLTSHVYLHSNTATDKEALVQMIAGVPQAGNMEMRISQGRYTEKAAKLLPQTNECDIIAAEGYLSGMGADNRATGQKCIENGLIAGQKLWYFAGNSNHSSTSYVYFIWKGTVIIAKWDTFIPDEQALDFLRKAFDGGHQASPAEIEHLSRHAS